MPLWCTPSPLTMGTDLPRAKKFAWMRFEKQMSWAARAQRINCWFISSLTVSTPPQRRGSSMQLWWLATVTRGTCSSPSSLTLGPLTTASRRSIPWTRVELNTFNQILDETPTVETVTADTALQRDADLVFEDIYFLQILRQSRHI